MKKLLAAVLSIVMLLSFVACDSTNTTGNKNGNSGTTKDTSHTHEYGEWKVVRKATCTKDGKEERVCDCGEKETQEIPAEHTFGEWEVVLEATCTEAGEQERSCKCGETQTKAIPAGHSYGEWIVSREATCAQKGEKYAVCSVCDDEKTESIDKTSTHTYNDGTVIKEPTCTVSGTKRVTCTVCGTTKEESVSALGHTTDYTGKCSRCGLVTLNMTSTEIENAKKVESMSHSVGEYSDEISISITLEDSNSYAIQIPVYVDVKIVDDDGNLLFDKTLIKKSSQSKITIDYEDLEKATNNTGTIYYKVYNDYVSFDTISKELEELPWTVELELPDLPQTVSDLRFYASSCKVTNITYKVNGYGSMSIYLSGEKTYDEKGNNYSQSCKIGWKLYDEDGYVIDDGTCYTSSVKVGEKFKDAECWIGGGIIKRGKTYRLVIMNVS